MTVMNQRQTIKYYLFHIKNMLFNCSLNNWVLILFLFFCFRFGKDIWFCCDNHEMINDACVGM